jgi:hypothetical protein
MVGHGIPVQQNGSLGLNEDLKIWAAFSSAQTPACPILDRLARVVALSFPITKYDGDCH